jgi:hypothetical protein
MKKEALEKIKKSSRGSVKLEEGERPILFHTRRFNYLVELERLEIVKALLTLTILENRAREKLGYI